MSIFPTCEQNHISKTKTWVSTGIVEDMRCSYVTCGVDDRIGQIRNPEITAASMPFTHTPQIEECVMQFSHSSQEPYGGLSLLRSAQGLLTVSAL